MELQLVHLILFDKYLNFSIFSTFCNCSFSLNSHVFLWNIFLWPVDLSLAFILEQFLQDRGFFFPEFGCPKTFLSCFLFTFLKHTFSRCSSDNCVHGSCCVVFYRPGSCHFCCKLPLFTQATKCLPHLATLNFFLLASLDMECSPQMLKAWFWFGPLGNLGNFKRDCLMGNLRILRHHLKGDYIPLSPSPPHLQYSLW